MVAGTLNATDQRFRILSLDGGGVRGIFTAAALAQLESDLGRRVVDHFDLIVGTSTGGILNIGLGLGLPASELLRLYIENADRIFAPTKSLARSVSRLRHAFGPKYALTGLQTVLREKLGDMRLGESRVRLVVPTFDALKGTSCTFKTAHHERAVHDYNLSAVEVALATAAAPTYFESVEIKARPGSPYLDGGVWANSPVLVGIVEAVHFLGRGLADIDLLSIGTTEEQVDFVAKRWSGVLGWALSIVDVMMAAQTSAAQAQGRLLVGEESFHRINFKTGQGKFPMDDARPDSVNKLAALGRSVARASEHQIVVADRFLNGLPAAKFVPLRRVSREAEVSRSEP